MFDNYTLALENDRYDLHILRRPSWGERFQAPGVREGQITGGKGSGHQVELDYVLLACAIF
jgi:hypothetical protein